MRSSPLVTELKPGDHAQKRRLAASRWPDKNDEFAVLNPDRHAVNNLQTAKALAHIGDFDRSHIRWSYCGWALLCHAGLARSLGVSGEK